MRRYAATVLAVTLAGGTALAALPAASASAVTPPSQTFVVPANGVFTVTGHGWGHGHGMSQWGAKGRPRSASRPARSSAPITRAPQRRSSRTARSGCKLTATNS